MPSETASAPIAPRRIFLSYGHDEHADLARRLKQDLEARGHLVWFDEERLKPGGDWEAFIERGLDWVAESPSLGHVVLLMTPYSVRRPDGFCLNEVARALMRRVPVMPVMVVWCEPPLSISRIQWLDMRDCVPVASFGERYESKLKRLVNALESEGVDVEGAQSRLLTLLQPLSFDTDLDWRMTRFTGRGWVTSAIDAWLDDKRAGRVFWLTGPHGVGKTTIAAWYSAHSRDVVAFHLCRQGHARKADPRHFVLSIAYQLSTQMPAYEKALNALPLEQIVRAESDAETLFDDLLIQPLSQVRWESARPAVIVVDAVDEATREGRNELATLLAERFAGLPSWLRLVVTSSTVSEVSEAFQGVTPFVLDPAADDNRQELRTYLERELRQFAGNEPLGPAVETILDRSAGTFLYADLIRQDLASGKLSLDRLDQIPTGLGGVYLGLFKRRFPDPAAYESGIRPALEVLAATPEPLALSTLADLMRWDEYDQNAFQRAVGSLFVVAEGRIYPFHQTVMNWLTQPDRAGAYFVSIRKGHKQLADRLWREYRERGVDVDASLVVDLPMHLRLSGNVDGAFELLQDDQFLGRFLSLMSSNDVREELIACWTLIAPDSRDRLIERFPASGALAKGLYLARQGRPDEAVECFESVNSGLSSGLAALFWIGLAWLYKDSDIGADRRTVLQKAAAALHHAASASDNARGAVLWGEATRSLGWLLKDLGALEDAEAAFKEALAIYERFDMARQVAWTRRDLGCFYRDGGRSGPAEEQLTQADAAFRRAGDARNTAITLKDLGVLFLTRAADQPERRPEYVGQALAAFDSARQFARLARTGDLNAWLMRYEGIAHAMAGHIAEGRQLITRAAAQFQEFQAANQSLSTFCAAHADEIRRPHLLELYGHLPVADESQHRQLLETAD